MSLLVHDLNRFTGTNTDIDTTTEADWRKFGGLDFNDSDIAIRKGHLVYSLIITYNIQLIPLSRLTAS